MGRLDAMNLWLVIVLSLVSADVCSRFQSTWGHHGGNYERQHQFPRTMTAVFRLPVECLGLSRSVAITSAEDGRTGHAKSWPRSTSTQTTPLGVRNQEYRGTEQTAESPWWRHYPAGVIHNIWNAESMA